VDTLSPTYKLVYDAPGSSSALDMAAQLGLPSLVVERARGLSSEQGRKLDGLLKGLALKQAALDDERVAVAREFEEAATAKAAARAREEALQEEERTLKRKAREGMLVETQRVKAQLRDAVEQTRAALKEAEGSKDARGSMERALGHLATVTELSETLTRQDEEERRAEARQRSFDAPLKVGSRVHVVTLNVPAEVLELTAKDALVAAGALRVRVQLKDLVPPAPRKGGPPPVVVKPLKAGGDEEVIPRTLDLRGERVDDAMERLNVFLDRAYGQPTGTLTVIHGHGTGAMRAAVRELLEKHPLVLNSRKGNEREGGSGATVVTLKDS
jgi:DNA mismatch repair protein MutS2